MSLKNLFNGFLFIIVILIHIIIHELGHCLIAMYFGNYCGGISFEGGHFKTDILLCSDAIEEIRIILIFGHIFGLLFSTIITVVGWVKNDELLYVSGMVCMSMELFYLAISPIIKVGDMYSLLLTFNYKNYVLYSITMFLLMGYVLFKLVRGFIKLVKKNYGFE